VAFQSLYRRYRPRRFGEVRGQEHVMRALRNAVRDSTVSHAYLFSGPRGTGKTSSARILAKALNCEAPVEGEPDCTCESCLAVEAGRSMDVVELDAASNNGVDAMRDLVSRVALGTGGRAKVYIVDEVHMLSAAASNALLKTLEEPPAHVTFVLATTDPQKVLPTIRSRTQHFEFRLLSPDVLADHLRWVVDDAGIAVDDEAIALAVRRGRGSARDALSALDQIIAGGIGEEDASLDELLESLCERDTARALAAIAMAANAGREPRQLAEALLANLRDALLSVLAPDVVSLPDEAMEQIADQGRRLGPAAVVRALDAIGEALLAMRDAPDPRVTLEVALVRVTRPDLDTSPAAIVERLERLERGGVTASAPAAVPAPPVSGREPAPQIAPRPPSDVSAAPASPASGKPALGAMRKARQALGAEPSPAAEAGAPAPAAEPAPVEEAAAPAPASDLTVTLPGVQGAWDTILKGLRPRAKGMFTSGRLIGVEENRVVYGFPSETVRDMAEGQRPELEAALAGHFGAVVPVRLVVDGTAVAPSPAMSSPTPDAAPDDDPGPDLTALTDAPAADATSPVDHLTKAFPGAEVIDEGGR
jgi:DNA polymerase-3 subunit gamma/tau